MSFNPNFFYHIQTCMPLREEAYLLLSVYTFGVEFKGLDGLSQLPRLPSPVNQPRGFCWYDAVRLKGQCGGRVFDQ